MIEIFNQGNEDYTKNGDSTLFPISCDIQTEINKVWTLEIQHPIDEDGKWKYIKEGNRIRVNSFNGEQLFFIVKTDKSEEGVHAKAYPIFMESANDCVILDRRVINKTGKEALDIILSANSKYSASSNITKKATAYYVLRNAMDAITNEDNGFLTRWGGEIYFNNYQIIINERIGGDYGVSILYGKNLKTNGLRETIDIENVVTRIIPKAYNGYTLPGDKPWVDSPLINSYPTIRAKVVEYSHIRLESDVTSEDEEGIIICSDMEALYYELRKAATAEFETGIDKPDVSIECDMALIHNTEEYAEFKDLETVGLGDTVYCEHYKLGITTTARVVSMVWDCIREEVTSVTIGAKSKGFIDRITTSIISTEKALTPSGGVIAEQLRGFVDGAYAQLRLQNTIAKKQDVRAILFEDLDPDSPTFGAMSLGTQGFQISRSRTPDDRDWVWSTAATSDGLIANVIVTGLLTDKVGRNFWNLDTGEFSLKSGAVIEGYATEENLESVETTLKSDIDDLRAMIDGQIMTWFYSGTPSLTRPPVTLDPSDPDNTGWDTDSEKRSHIGDLYYDTDTGKAYRFIFENGLFSWMELSDSDVAKALELAQDALKTAEARIRVFLTTPVPPYIEGDLYIPNDGTIYVCVTPKEEGGRYSPSDFVQRDNYASLAALAEVRSTAEEAHEVADAAKNIADGAKETADSAKTIADSAKDKADAAEEAVNESAKTITVQYYLSNSPTTLSGGSWNDEAPTWRDGSYIWIRNKAVTNGGVTTYGEAACVTGAKGAEGAPGEPGTPATVYYLEASTDAIVKNYNNVLVPSNVTFSSKKKSTGNPSAYAGRFIIAESTNGTSWTNKYTSSANESSKAYTPSANTIKFIRCNLYLAGGTSTLLDTQTVPIVFDGINGTDGAKGDKGDTGAKGDDAYTVVLTNENHTFAGTTTSAIAGNTTCGIVAYKGATRMAATIGTITGKPTGMTTSISNNGTTNASFTVIVTTEMVTKNGILTVPVTVDGKVFNMIFTYSLALTGAKGAKGDRGQTGVGVSSITPIYYCSNVANVPAKPTTKVTTNSKTAYNTWNLACPTWTETYQYYFTSVEVLLTDGTRYWADSSPDYATANANAVAFAANTTANKAIVDATAAKDNAEQAVRAAASAQEGADGANRKLNAMYGTCTTAANVAAKVAKSADFVLYTGATINIYFTYANTKANPTLSIEDKDGNKTAAKPIYVEGAAITTTFYWTAKSLVQFTYNGSQWVMQADGYQMTFNHLTQGGTQQALLMDTNGDLYINASLIKTGELDAALVKAGILSDGVGLNYWNMVTGEFSLTSGAIGGDVSIKELDDMVVGGTNLVSRKALRKIPTEYNFLRIPFYEPLEANEEYTLQLWGFTLDSGSTGVGVYWGGGSNQLGKGQLFKPDANGYGKFTFKVTEANTTHAQAVNLFINLYNYANGHTGSNADAVKWKLEKGNVATDYSVSPEDVNGDIAAGIITAKEYTNENLVSSLSPFFGYSNYTVNDYWTQWPDNKGFTFTDMGDGWIRAEKASTTAAVRQDVIVAYNENIEAGADYTFLFEFRNNKGSGSSGTPQFYIVQNDNKQFWGGTIKTLLEGDGDTASVTFGANGNIPYGTNTTYIKRFVKTSEPYGSSHWTGTVNGLICFVWNIPANNKVDIECRISMYKGVYSGPYKPYVPMSLFAKSDETRAIADIAYNRTSAMYGTCSDAANTVAKKVTCDNFNGPLYIGATINVYFANTNTAKNPTLNVNNTGAKPIYVYGAAITNTYYWSAKSTQTFVYNGSQWIMSATDNYQMTFNKLTNGGTQQAIKQDSNGNLYINGTYIKAGTIEGITLKGNTITGNSIDGGTITGATISGGKFTTTGTESGTTEITDGRITNTFYPTTDDRYVESASMNAGGIGAEDTNPNRTVFALLSPINGALFGIATDDPLDGGVVQYGAYTETTSKVIKPEMVYYPGNSVSGYNFTPLALGNEVLEFSNCIFNGYITSSKDELCFFVPSYKMLHMVDSATLDSTPSLYVRGYGNASAVTIALTSFPVDRIRISNGGFFIAIKGLATKLASFENNSPVSISTSASLNIKVSTPYD